MNCTMPTCQPWPSARSTRPSAAVRLALAGAGMDDEQALLDGLGRHLGVLHGLALLHLLAVAVASSLMRSLTSLRRSCGGFGLTISGRPATVSTTRSAWAASRWCRRPAASRKRRARALSGTIPSPTSLPTSTSGPGAPRAGGEQSRRGSRHVGLRQDQVGEPERQAIDQDGPFGRGDRLRQGERHVAGAPRFAPPGAVLGDARDHLVVEGLRGGEVEPGAGAGLDQPLGVGALAGARAAEDEGHAWGGLRHASSIAASRPAVKPRFRDASTVAGRPRSDYRTPA